MSPSRYLTAAFYKFVDLARLRRAQTGIAGLCEFRRQGPDPLAREGINSTIAGAPDDVHGPGLPGYRPTAVDLQHKESFADKAPFYRMKVRLKKEIVTMQVEGISPTHMAGTYVKPGGLNALISDPDVVVDTRNDYEVGIGTFAGAINPHIKTSLQNCPSGCSSLNACKAHAGKTQGRRCRHRWHPLRKSTAYMRAQGYEEVQPRRRIRAPGKHRPRQRLWRMLCSTSGCPWATVCCPATTAVLSLPAPGRWRHRIAPYEARAACAAMRTPVLRKEQRPRTPTPMGTGQDTPAGAHIGRCCPSQWRTEPSHAAAGAVLLPMSLRHARPAVAVSQQYCALREVVLAHKPAELLQVLQRHGARAGAGGWHSDRPEPGHHALGPAGPRPGALVAPRRSGVDAHTGLDW